MGRRWRWRRRREWGISGLYPTLVLLMISKGISHGYDIRKKVEEIMGVPLPDGFIYVTLARLEASGLIASSRMIGDPRRKRLYELTPLGRQELELRIEELRRLKLVIDRIISFYGQAANGG